MPLRAIHIPNLGVKIPHDLLQGVTILLLAVFFGQTLPAVEEPNPPAAKGIDFKEIKMADEQGTAIILDAREPELFEAGHIPHARNLPVSTTPSQIRDFLQIKEIKNQPIITYCAESSCEDSKTLARKLISAGAKDVSVYPGGWSEWAIVHGVKTP